MARMREEADRARYLARLGAAAALVDDGDAPPAGRGPATPSTTPEDEAREEAAACRAEGPNNAWHKTKCNEAVRGVYEQGRYRRLSPAEGARICARQACPHHVHSWARGDAVYCSGTCRMAVLRERRRAAR